jgi:mRNA interferase RelE/StbE
MKVAIHSIPAKYLSRLPEPDRSHIKSALVGIEKEPPEGDIRPLTGQKGCFRLKVGDFRVLFRYTEDVILVTHIEPRGQVYAKKNRGKKR